VRLGLAPQIDDHLFVGREQELQKLQTWLKPMTEKQNIVALWGMGGMGKTQLSMRFIR
jgi:tRNA A37 threonylcarbamoyladenosine biosynthesis protein TsaE